MSDAQLSFLDLVDRGEANLDEIDDYVDRWHQSLAGRGLAAYLGMTDEEYGRWLAEPDLLAAIAQARRKQRTVVS